MADARPRFGRAGFKHSSNKVVRSTTTAMECGEALEVVTTKTQPLVSQAEPVKLPKTPKKQPATMNNAVEFSPYPSPFENATSTKTSCKKLPKKVPVPVPGPGLAAVPVPMPVDKYKNLKKKAQPSPRHAAQPKQQTQPQPQQDIINYDTLGVDIRTLPPSQPPPPPAFLPITTPELPPPQHTTHNNSLESRTSKLILNFNPNPNPNPPPGFSPQPQQPTKPTPRPRPPPNSTPNPNNYDVTKTSDPNYGAGRSITILHVAEKPSIGQAVANALGHNSNSFTTSKTIATPVHEIQTHTPFPKAPKATSITHKVTSVTGHVFNVDFAPMYQDWDSCDPQELYDAPIVRKACKSSMLKHLQTAGKDVDFIVLWMDCDREGENINFEVLSITMGGMRHGSSFERVYRAKFSAICESDILKAYETLIKPDQNQSLAVDARQELDLKVGISFSRFQTRFFQGRYSDLQSSVLSYGPCQTPTLGFVVKRHIEIETFCQRPYWVFDLGITKAGRICRASWGKVNTFNQNKIEKANLDFFDLEKHDNIPLEATVVRVTKKEKKQGRPTPMNTVAFLKACSKSLGIGPHNALHVAERLYLSGFLSYPRTESSSYPQSFDIKGTLRAQSNDSRWGAYVSRLLHNGINQAKGGFDAGDHPPITPTISHAGPHDLSGESARVYDLVVRHFIATVSPDAVWMSTKVDIEVEKLKVVVAEDDKNRGLWGEFGLAGKELLAPGFLEILLHRQYGEREREDTDKYTKDDNDLNEADEKSLPEFSIGEIIQIRADKNGFGSATLEVKEKLTQPPTHLTESELITVMEKNGIGTDASIPTHIENIQKRKYAELIPGRKLKPSKLGLVLAQGYFKIDANLILPQVRADIEGQCDLIARGVADKEVVVAEALDLFEVSERSERALRKTRILAMKCAKWLQT